MSSELRARLLVAAGGVPLGAFAAVRGGWFLGALIAGVAALAASEFHALARIGGARPLRWLGVPAAALLVLLAADGSSFAEWGVRALALLLVLALATLGAMVVSPSVAQAPMPSASATVLGALYTGGTLSFAVLIRNLPEHVGGADPRPWEGALLVFFPLAVTWAADSAAYFAGRRLGERKLAPAVSPGKTVVGGVAGLIAAIAVGAATGWALSAFPTVPMSPLAGGLAGLVLGVVGQVGDLAESLLKREAGVKDSGRLFPGHGGALDRFDALFFALPVAYGLFAFALRRG